MSVCMSSMLLCGLQVGAARVEANALADQAHAGAARAARPVRQLHDAGIARGIAVRDGEKCARAEALQLRLAVELGTSRRSCRAKSCRKRR